MVSTRLMSSSVGVGEGGAHSESGGRVTRLSSALPGSTSPHGSGAAPLGPGATPHGSVAAPHGPGTAPHGPSMALQGPSSSRALLPAPKLYSTGLQDLPIEVLEKIFGYLGFKSVSELRTVNRHFNIVCSGILNSTFQRLQNQMLHRFQAIKAKMPRRESARRSHPLACESDIIETLHMRLSLLQMTFGKHIERKHCCFFPGEILDEVYSILSYLKTTTKLARPYKVTDELFDLTTMAMEYFKEHIEPNLPEITYFGTDFFDITTTFSPGESNKSYMCLDSPPPAGFEGGAAGGGGGGGSGSGGGGGAGLGAPSCSYLEESLPPSPPPPQSNMVLRKRIHRIKQGMKKYNDQLSALRSDLRSCKRKTALQQKQILEQQKQIAEQQKQTVEYANRLDDYDKKNEETSRKFQTLLQELNKCKTELQYWRSRSPAVPPLCAECGAALRLSPAIAAQWAIDLSTEAVDGATPGGSGEPSAATSADTEPAKDKADKGTCKEAKVEPKGVCKEAKPDPKLPAKDNKPETKPKDKPESSKAGPKEDRKGVKREMESKRKERSDSSGEEGTPPARRRASADTAATPERKKRRLMRPRKL